jgi:hypothetical protein
MKKILFYGNCQLGALSKHIRNSSDEYQILNCEDYGLKKFWADEGLFATWSLENQDRQDEYYPKIIEAVKDCDVFIFQHHKDLVRREELTTQFLINELRPKSIGICLPSIQYYGYLYDVYSINRVVKRLYEDRMSASDILFYLLHVDDQDARHQMTELHNSSLEKIQTKDQEHQQLYKNYIAILDFIETNYLHQIIAYDHSHPSIHYYNKILNNLADYGIIINKLFNSNSILPGSTQLCPYELKYFNNHFSDLEDTTQHDKFFTFKLNEANIKKQIELIEKGKIK